MNYEEFLNSVESNDVSIGINPVGNRVPAGLDNEALFQLPLIAMIILLMSKNRRKPIVSEIGQLVGKVIGRYNERVQRFISIFRLVG